MVHTQADAVAEEVAKTIKDTLTYVKQEAPVALDSGRLASW